MESRSAVSISRRPAESSEPYCPLGDSAPTDLSGIQPAGFPGVTHTLVEQPFVKTPGAPVPELHALRHDPEASPERRPWHGTAAEPRLDVGNPRLELRA